MARHSQEHFHPYRNMMGQFAVDTQPHHVYPVIAISCTCAKMSVSMCVHVYICEAISHILSFNHFVLA